MKVGEKMGGGGRRHRILACISSRAKKLNDIIKVYRCRGGKEKKPKRPSKSTH